MVELFLSVQLSCSESQGIIDRIRSNEYLNSQIKEELITEIEKVTSNCSLNTALK
jgi:hypothetical protein